jgi:hypothetical protein
MGGWSQYGKNKKTKSWTEPSKGSKWWDKPYHLCGTCIAWAYTSFRFSLCGYCGTSYEQMPDAPVFPKEAREKGQAAR